MDRTQDVYRCTLNSPEAAGRIDTDRALADRVVHTERLDQGLRVVFTGGPDSRQLADAFVANERRCCGFFDFTVTETDGAVTLEITAPAADSAQQLVDAAQRVFEFGPDAVTAFDPRGSDDG